MNDCLKAIDEQIIKWLAELEELERKARIADEKIKQTQQKIQKAEDLVEVIKKK